MRRVATRLGVIKIVAFTVLATAGSAPLASQQIPPDEEWRTLDTDHFRVTFPAHLEPLGRRAADRAERARTELEAVFLDAPRDKIDILVTDHVDGSNGFAGVLPGDRITVFARPPADDLALAYFDDWLELVITHELAHIVHLDRAGNWAGKVGRAVFGRPFAAYPLFPGVDMPTWVVEGIATWYESEVTTSGRVRGTYHDMVLRTAALEGRFEDIGQAAGDSPQWPGGTRWYAYGSLFFDYLLAEYGEDKMAVFVEAVAGQWIPYRLDSAGQAAFGVSLTSAWEEWAAQYESEAGMLDARLAAQAPLSDPERLTVRARWAMRPKVSPDGGTLAYARSDGTRDQQIHVASVDGTNGRSLTRTNGLADFDWLPDGRIVFSQPDYTDAFRVFADLYTVDAAGQVTRVTRAARVQQPSADPDGRTVVALSEGEGTNGLVRVEMATGKVTPLVSPDPDVHWAYPAVSPDGEWIAASRWMASGHHDLVVLDRSGGIRAEVTVDRPLDMAPEWSPDGEWLVWGSDRSGIPNILGAPFDRTRGQAGTPRLLTNLRTGGAYPSIDPSGRWLYYSGYHVDGWEVERVSFDPEGAAPAPPVAARFAGPVPTRTLGSASGPVRGYSPFPTVLPSYWEPNLREPLNSRRVERDDLTIPSRELLGFAIGAQTGGVDLVGRHSYGALGRLFTTGGKAEGQLSYQYGGLGNPSVGFFASQGWGEDGALGARREAGAPLDTLFVLERTRTVSGNVTFQKPTLRRSAALTLSGGMVWEGRELLDAALQPETRYRLNRPTSRLSDFGASLSLSTARSRSFQMGGSAGASLFVRARHRSELSVPDSLIGVPGSDRSFDDLFGRVRAYVPFDGPGFGAHVIAVQAAVGTATGSGADAGHFSVGGATGSRETITGLDLFGGDFVLFPVRGYATSTRFGRYAWTASIEYRVPLVLVNRGFDAWPVHLDRVAGSFFFDAGNAWGPDLSPGGFQNARRATLRSMGAEVTVEVLTFWEVSMRFRTGLAVPLLAGADPRVYLRLGMPF